MGPQGYKVKGGGQDRYIHNYPFISNRYSFLKTCHFNNVNTVTW